MKASEIIRAIKDHGGVELRRRGSHVRMRCPCGQHFTTVPDHGSRDVPRGTQAAIERDLEPCPHFGADWLQ
jgi:predicted RNA binding protein YcfA (HicA-like mRNA interferase family)